MLKNQINLLRLLAKLPYRRLGGIPFTHIHVAVIGAGEDVVGSTNVTHLRRRLKTLVNKGLLYQVGYVYGLTEKGKQVLRR